MGAQGARPGLGHGCLQELDRFPAYRSDGREGTCKWCWLTGYIFDTFNELIQMSHTRKDSPVFLPPCFGLYLPLQRHVPAKAMAPTICRTRGQGLLPLTPFLGWNGLDAYSVAALCARRHSVIYTCCSIKKQIYSSDDVSTLLLTGQQAATGVKGECSLKSALSSEH